MRRMALVVMGAVLGLSGPAMAKDLAKDLRGTWTVDKVALLEADPPPFYKMATPEKKKEIQAKMLAEMPDISLEFTATSATMSSGKDVQPARYKITRTEKNTVWMDLMPEAKNGASPKTEKYSFEFVGADMLKMGREGDAATMTLNRKK